MPLYVEIIYVSFGVLVSVILPVLSFAVQEAWRPSIEHSTWSAKFQRFWKKSKRYVVLGLFSLITGIVVLAFVSSSSTSPIQQWYDAFIYGYLWDSTLQKLRNT